MSKAVEAVRRRLLRAAQALRQAGVTYAVIDGNAVAAWVSRVDEAAVRNTRDVDILLRRAILFILSLPPKKSGPITASLPRMSRSPRVPRRFPSFLSMLSSA